MTVPCLPPHRCGRAPFPFGDRIFRRGRWAIIVAAAALIGACTSAPPVADRVVVDDSFSIFARPQEVDLKLALKVAERDGQVMICAALSGDGPTAAVRPRLEDWRDEVVISLGDEEIADGVPFAPLHEGLTSLIGATADCAVTTRQWEPGFADRNIGAKIAASFRYRKFGVRMGYTLLYLALAPFNGR